MQMESLYSPTVPASEWRPKFVAAARGLIGTKWKHQGRGSSGVDCLGLLIAAAREAGLLAPPTPPAYDRVPTGALLLEKFDVFLRMKELTKIEPGDILVTRDDNVLLPCHCGVIGEAWGELRFIHAYAKARRVVESRYEDWQDRAIRAYEFG